MEITRRIVLKVNRGLTVERPLTFTIFVFIVFVLSKTCSFWALQLYRSRTDSMATLLDPSSHISVRGRGLFVDEPALVGRQDVG